MKTIHPFNLALYSALAEHLAFTLWSWVQILLGTGNIFFQRYLNGFVLGLNSEKCH